MKTEEDLIWEAYHNKQNLITERDDDFDYGCLMIYFDEDSAREIKNWSEQHIPSEFLHDFGIEEEPHVTCQYGFHKDITPDDITEFINKVKTPIEINLREISKFENEEYDVVKVDVDSPDLHDLSDYIRDYFDGKIEITYPDYHPHVTLAYVQKGKLPHIDDIDMFKGKNYVFDEFVYSTPNDEKFNITKG